MARKTLNYTVQDQGRDFGKVFVLTEMAATRAEAWAMRALLALMNAGVEVPEGFDKMGMAAMAEVGIKALAGLKWETAKPLIDEMLACVQIMPDPSKPMVIRNLIEDDVEEVITLIKLRAEVWQLHAGFLKAVAIPKSGKSVAAADKKTSPTT